MYRDIKLPAALRGLWQCCSVSCCACSPLTTLTEDGLQQDLDAQQACPGSAEAVVCIQEEAQSGTDPLSLCGAFGYPSGMELGVGWVWGKTLPLGYSMCRFACMGVAEDPSVLLVRMLCNPSALSALRQQQLLASCWSPHAVPRGCNTPLLIFIFICSIGAAVKQLLHFAQAEGQCEEVHSFQYLCENRKNQKIKLKILKSC